MAIFTDFICIFGLVGNGIVLWLFGFRIKRNPFTTYILNLTICDFGFLLFLFLFNIFPMIYIFSVHLDTVILDILLGYDTFLSLLLLMYSSGQFLLTAISLDRCVAVLFPDWYYCHRSPNVSTTVCSLIWVFLFLLCGMQLTLLFTGNNDDFHLMLFYQYFAISSICLLLMTISSLILFIKFHLKLQTCQYGKLLTVILLTLLFALLFSFLTSAFSIAMYLQKF
uniref:mas-related G-protein coupled receptor member H-like n=1 Tax=Euleptes europaea TaxID=460621 RepID=UPI0025402FAD|nr:mas-related G-protein coupled receptor member H-like [Euleptes europaea]